MKAFRFKPLEKRVEICGITLTIDCRSVHAKLRGYSVEFGQMAASLKKGEMTPAACVMRYQEMLAEMVGQENADAILKDKTVTLIDMNELMYYLLAVCKEAEDERAESLTDSMAAATDSMKK